MEATTHNTDQNRDRNTNPRSGKAAVILGVAVAALAAVSGYLFFQLDEMRTEVATLNAGLAQQVETVRESYAATSGKHQRQIEGLQEELAVAREQAKRSAGTARVAAQRHAEKLAAELAAKQEEQRQAMAEQIAGVQEETATRFDQVSTDVDAARTEIAGNRDEISTMVSGLGRMNGDMGVMSGRIATNAEELEALRALGEREYFEFEVSTKADKPVRVETVGLDLRHTDPGKSRFTMNVLADDKVISKKNRTVNEPIQFYVGGRGGLPYEIVVNKVDRGVISGYLSTPKVDTTKLARR